MTLFSAGTHNENMGILFVTITEPFIRANFDKILHGTLEDHESIDGAHEIQIRVFY